MLLLAIKGLHVIPDVPFQTSSPNQEIETQVIYMAKYFQP